MPANGTRLPGHRDERHAAPGPVECARCGAAVLAAKFSPQHTTVQWSAAAVRACREFGAADRPSALVEGCTSLRDSVDAVRVRQAGQLTRQYAPVQVKEGLEHLAFAADAHQLIGRERRIGRRWGHTDTLLAPPRAARATAAWRPARRPEKTQSARDRPLT